MKRRIYLRYTCCDHCRKEHANKVTAYMHWVCLRALDRPAHIAVLALALALLALSAVIVLAGSIG